MVFRYLLLIGILIQFSCQRYKLFGTLTPKNGLLSHKRCYGIRLWESDPLVSTVLIRQESVPFGSFFLVIPFLQKLIDYIVYLLLQHKCVSFRCALVAISVNVLVFVSIISKCMCNCWINCS